MRIISFARKCKLLVPGGLAFFLISLASVVASESPQSDEPETKLQVFVSIMPQAFFVEQIAGDLVEVEVLVGPGQSPATYEPSPKQMTRLAASRLFFYIGVPFEKHLVEKVQKTFKDLKLIDTRQGITLRAMEGHDHDGHEHEDGRDPHIWLSPPLVKIQAENIFKALSAEDSAREAVYRKNLELLQSRLDSLDMAIEQKIKPYAGRKFYAFHPSYGYFADRYGLTQVAVETEGKEPSARQLAALIEQAKAEDIRIIFVQPEFAVKSAVTIAAAVNGRVVKLDPLARDYFNNLTFMADEMVRALSIKE
ncbi:MAG: metal ABC transporter solute-binding protein, Zn/Mn family [Candidatus Zixiibacteriota bacterium]